MYFPITLFLTLGSLAAAETFKVMVGMNSTGGLATVFTPNQITAQQGDHILFIYRGKNHTVTQSSFAEPCTLQLNTVTGLAGANSGFMPVAANATELPTFEVQINDASSPQWFFCNQGNHCNSGMVFAVNAPSTGAKSFDTWVEKAKTASHPDPALNQTAPFTPPSPSSSAGNSSSSDDGNTATDVPLNAAPAPTYVSTSVDAYSSTAAAGSTSGNGLSLSLGAIGTSEAVRVGSTTTPAQAEATASRNAGFRVRMGAHYVLSAAFVLGLSVLSL